jgi:bifunctional non-homologous end joining protein LigD
MAARKTTTEFIEPMLLVRSDTLPEGPDWAYELKLDGYRALGIKSYGVAHLRPRNNKSFDGKYPAIVAALARLPEETVIDGEVVALDESGRPSFSALQNGSATAQLCYYVFDVMVLAGRNVMSEPLSARRELLRRQVLPQLTDPIREAPQFDASLSDLIRAVREQGLEGIVGKRLDSAYEPGQRSGAWRKMRVNRPQGDLFANVVSKVSGLAALPYPILPARDQLEFSPPVGEFPGRLAANTTDFLPRLL